MAKARPNDPCPCGSARKYKKCCGAPESQHAREVEEVVGEIHRRFAGLVEDKRVDDAVDFVSSLLDQFDDSPELLQRAAELYERRGNLVQALDRYRRLDQMHACGGQDRASVLDKIAQLEARIGAGPD